MIALQPVMSLLETVINVPVYQDEIPESYTGSAVAVTVLSPDYNRVLSGDVSGRTDTFRVAVVAQHDNDVKSIVENLETLDNTRNSDFARIYSRLVNWEQRGSNQPYRRAFVDVRVKY